ncbi:MAG: MBOAT family protein [Alphaproteobacteria bacterium]|nr:MBOAT family protein [Alphaproteobacteria bacterium]
MLFNSTIFLFGFLPVALIVFFTLGRLSVTAARIWLAAASLYFYAWWNPPYLVLLAISILFNFGVGRLLQEPERFAFLPSRKLVLGLSLLFNLGFLGYFKYYAFIVQNIDTATGADFVVHHIALPLAISFFTFQKIAYLVDSYLGKVKDRSFINYVLFAAFFPQLIAGPIVHYSDLFPQFRKVETYRFQWPGLTDGLTLFLLGLAKKVVLADEFARYSDIMFNGAQAGATITLAPAWVGALSYTLQLYFDFSGYSDMAIGMAKMFNIELPLNFWSPYKSGSIIEFWRRWHMTLSRFLRDYVYIPLGGNRGGEARRYRNLLLTMLVGGIWHGAGWTFVAWGALHGVALAVNHLWAEHVPRPLGSRLYRMVAHLMTLLVVVCGWVIFRSPSMQAAGRVFAGMSGRNGAVLPDQFLNVLHPLRALFGGVGQVPYLGDMTVMGAFEAFFMLGLGGAIVFFAPNLYQFGKRARLVLVALSFAFVLQKILFAGAMSPFLYFQF